ncbi:aldose epimerase family protein [Pseudovibrio exalbescens]|uniref:Aldose 1-epimerase n=1 Tax=Pseudovibrio exalbescens TaxID=197461 RepID=A0A1U7JGL2_9HYPH|nr:aldose epimerase family protein [Pseudovibrio exalbescens]OKL43869.1 hypothetical protein A3843_11405 [Pseudovibrio exalbescens]
MSIEEEVLGKHNGVSVVRHRLTDDNGQVVSILNLGVTVQRWQVPIKDGLRDVVLGYKNWESYLPEGPALGCLVGPLAGRVEGASFVHDGKRFNLTRNSKGVHIHGGPAGIGKLVWGVDRDEENNALRYTLSLPDGHMGYPGKRSLEVEYRLANGRLSLAIYCSTDALTPMNISQHIAWNLSGRAPIFDHTLTIPSRRRVEFDQYMVPTGQLLSIDQSSSFFFARSKRMRDGFGHLQKLDDCLVLDDRGRSDTVAAKLVSPDSALALRILSDQPAVVVYNCSGLQGAGKSASDVKLQPFAGVCIEDQAIVGAINHPHLQDVFITPDVPYRHMCHMEIGVDQE